MTNFELQELSKKVKEYNDKAEKVVIIKHRTKSILIGLSVFFTIMFLSSLPFAFSDITVGRFTQTIVLHCVALVLAISTWIGVFVVSAICDSRREKYRNEWFEHYQKFIQKSKSKM